MNLRFQAHEVEKGRQQHIACKKNKDRKGQAQVEALHDIYGNFFRLFSTAELGDDR